MKLQVSHDLEADVICFRLSDAPIEEGDEPEPGVIVSYDKDGNVVSIEVLQVSKLNFSQVMHKLTAVQTAAC
jgi:uncharacterized protein YuzE